MSDDTGRRNALLRIRAVAKVGGHTLNLASTQLSELPPEIGQLKRLLYLNLSGTQLSELPPEIGQLKRLTRLDLARTHLSELPLEIEHLKKLQNLNLGYNELSELPPEIGQLTALQNLNLSYTQLTELPPEIGQLKRLQKLDLTGTELIELPPEIGQLEKLTRLDLAGTQLTELPLEIGHLTKLEYLDLRNTQLSELPPEVARLTALLYLDLRNTQLSELPPEIGQLTALQTLNLLRTKLTELPPEIGQLTELRDLDFDGTQLSVLPPEIGQLTALRNLDLRYTQLSELPPEIGQLTALQKLYLVGTQLRELPPEIGRLTGLLYLDLSNTQLRELPPEIGQLIELQSIYLNGNRLHPELASAYEEGVGGILEYLRAQLEQQIAVHEGKLVLVGEGAVGKTSLLGAIRGDEFIENRDTTHGVEIKPVELESPGLEESMTLNGWDFGGQAIYRSTHQLFFTAPAIYLATWKPREGPEEGRIEEWIKLVKHRAFDEERPDNRPRVLVVATHGGPKERQAHIDKEALRQQFGDLLVSFHHVDSKSGDEIEALKKKIAETAASLPMMGRRVPASWQRVLTAVRERGEKDPWITYEQYLELCANEEVSVTRAKLYASLLNDLGHLIHYRGDSLLKDTMILKPDWLSKAISFVLEDRQIKKQRGLVRHDRLTKIWNDPARVTERYPKALHPIFLRLMESFDLSYRVALPLEAESSSLVAELVPGARPENYRKAWPAEAEAGDVERVQICRVVDAQNGLPARAEGLLYRLIVRLHRYSLGRENFEDSCHWQKGLVVDDGYNGRALIEEIGSDFRITVRAAVPEGLLHEVSKDVKFLVEDFWKGLDCRIGVPCPACRGVIDKEAITGSVQKSYPEVFCSSCQQWQLIAGLISQPPAPPAPEKTLEVLLEVQRETHAEVLRNRRVILEGHQVLSSEIRAVLSYVDSKFVDLLESLTSEARNGPRLFSLEPVKPDRWGRPTWLSEKIRLTLWCEHSRLPLPLLNGKGSTDGVYTLNLPRDWVVKALPFLRGLLSILNIVLPVAFSAAKLELDDATYEKFANELDLTQKSLKAGIQTSEKGVDWVIAGDSPKGFEKGSGIEAHGALLRKLHVFLREQDAGFGGLERVRNRRNEFLWIHPQFKAEYRA